MDVTFTYPQLVEVAHAIVRALKIANGEPDPGSFQDAESWAQESTMERVRAVLNGASIDGKAEHERWAEDKKLRGYVYGAVRNDDPAKGPLTHPLLVPYEELGVIDRLKDSLPNAVVADLANL